MLPEITIAMATRQGERYLAEQLDSLARQSVMNWRLIVSDDASTDGTRQIVEQFADAHPERPVHLISGPEAGATANFLHLTMQITPGSWFAFCDQDDVWQPDKLALAAQFLREQSGPAVYAARTTICDENLNILTPAPAYSRPLTFRNALIQACMPGNTIVGNAQALQILQQAAPHGRAAGVISHDWWVYQVMSGAGATLMRDKAQVLLYRQHQKNVMGRNDTMRAQAARITMLTDGRFAGWLAGNLKALKPVSGLLTPENRQLLDRFAKALSSRGPTTLAEFLRMGLYRQTKAGTVALMAAALAGRLQTGPQN